MYDVDTSEVTIYKDGESVVGGGEETLNVNSGEKQIKIASLSRDDLGGEICEIRIWNTARTEAEINANKDALIDPTNPDLLAYWDGEYDGEQLIDKKQLEPTNHCNSDEGSTFRQVGIYEKLNETFHPLELPFNSYHSEVRHTLGAMMENMNLNQIARRSQQNDYAIDNTTFTLIPNVVDKLNLYDSHLQVLQDTAPDAQTM